MPEYIVRTAERVEGTYRVEADSPEEVIEMLEELPIPEDFVEQIDYMAFDVEVIEIKDA